MGVEPTTTRLKVGCSTTGLPGLAREAAELKGGPGAGKRAASHDCGAGAADLWQAAGAPPVAPLVIRSCAEPRYWPSRRWFSPSRTRSARQSATGASSDHAEPPDQSAASERLLTPEQQGRQGIVKGVVNQSFRDFGLLESKNTRRC